MKTEDFEYEIVIAVDDDIKEVVRLALEFWGESGNSSNGEADPVKYENFLRHELLHRECTRIILAKTPAGRIIGYSIIYAMTDYKDHLDGEMYQFFVHPDYRATGVARELVRMSVQVWDDWGCRTVYAIASPEIGNTELSHFRNLWAKFGFAETGIVMTRRTKGE